MQKLANVFAHNLEIIAHSEKGIAQVVSGKNIKKKRNKYVGLYGGYAGQNTHGLKSIPQEQKPSSISLSKMKESKQKDREKRVREKAIRQKGNTAKGKSKRKSKDFTKLDKNGRPQIKFDCSSAERREYIAILDRPRSSPLRRRLIAKIEEQVGRLYTRYRRGFNPTWEMDDRERKYMSEFGVLCLRRGITPSQFLDYWRINIKTFADGNMNIIPPNLVSSPAFVETVVCTADVQTGGGKRNWKASKYHEDPAPVHSYDDPSHLNKKLRSGLESAGFDTSAYSDRDLLSIQSAAVHRANGMDIFVGKPMREMVKWASEHIYSKRSSNED